MQNFALTTCTEDYLLFNQVDVLLSSWLIMQVRCQSLAGISPAIPPIAPLLMEAEFFLALAEPTGFAANVAGAGAAAAGATASGATASGAPSPPCASAKRCPIDAEGPTGAGEGAPTGPGEGAPSGPADPLNRGAGAGAGDRGMAAGERDGAPSVQLPDAQFRLAPLRPAGIGIATGGHVSGMFAATGLLSTV